MLQWTSMYTYPFKISDFIFFQQTPKSGIAESHGIFIFNFWQTSLLFSIAAVPVYIPTRSFFFPSFWHWVLWVIYIVCLLTFYQISFPNILSIYYIAFPFYRWFPSLCKSSWGFFFLVWCSPIVYFCFCCPS